MRDGLRPEVAALLDGAFAGRPAAFDPARMRADMDAAAPLLGGPPQPVASVRDVDGPVPLRVYAPARARGVVLLLHGGGWVIGSLESHDQLARMLANAAGATVVAAGYRLAPEHPFPAGLDDCEAALAWVRDAHPGAPLAVAGDSAGGNLAAVLARRHRDLRLQGLIYPVCDAPAETGSYADYGDDLPLSAGAMRWFFDCYRGDPADPDVSPLRAGDLSGLPPAHVVLASHDVLLDEGRAYAARLAAAGVPVRVTVHEGTMHGFVRWPATVPAAHEAIAELGAALRQALA